MSTPRRQLHLKAFLMSSGHHQAAWRLPKSDPHADFQLGDRAVVGTGAAWPALRRRTARSQPS
jgi:hypothetical protein